MSELDLAEAVEAAAEADWKFQIGDLPDGATLEAWRHQPAYVRRSHRGVVQHLVEAAAPIIERQVRDAMAEEIADYWDAFGELIDTNNGARLAFEVIGEIARGER